MYQVEMHADKQKRMIIFDDSNYCKTYLPYEIKKERNIFYASISGFTYKGTKPMGDSKKTPDEALDSLLSWLRNSLNPDDTNTDWQ